MTTKPRETQIEGLIQLLEDATADWREIADTRRAGTRLLSEAEASAYGRCADELSALLREETPAPSGCQHMYSSGRTCGRHAGDAVHVSDVIDCGDFSVFNTHRYVAPKGGEE